MRCRSQQRLPAKMRDKHKNHVDLRREIHRRPVQPMPKAHTRAIVRDELERNLTAIAPHGGTATSDKPGTNRATIRTRTPQRPKKRSVFLTHVSRDSDSLQTV